MLADAEKAYISRYALGRDYHKVMRGRLAKLARRINNELGKGRYRAFVDSAPVMERALAENAGLGWIGKNTMLINDKAGSWFFLGEIYTDIPLPPIRHKKPNTAVRAERAWIFAQPRHSPPHGCWMPANVSLISLSNTTASYRSLFANPWEIAFMVAMTVRSCARGINLRSNRGARFLTATRA